MLYQLSLITIGYTMAELSITHDFVRKLTKNIRSAYGNDVKSTQVLDLISDAFGWKSDAMMHALKTKPDGFQKQPNLRSDPVNSEENMPLLNELLTPQQMHMFMRLPYQGLMRLLETVKEAEDKFNHQLLNHAMFDMRETDTFVNIDSLYVSNNPAAKELFLKRLPYSKNSEFSIAKEKENDDTSLVLLYSHPQH